MHILPHMIIMIIQKNSKLAATVSRIDLILLVSKVSTEYAFV